MPYRPDDYECRPMTLAEEERAEVLRAVLITPERKPMTISETIAALEKIKAEVGDVRVTRLWFGDIADVNPKVEHLAIPRGRQWKMRFWHMGMENDKGERVVLM